MSSTITANDVVLENKNALASDSDGRREASEEEQEQAPVIQTSDPTILKDPTDYRI